VNCVTDPADTALLLLLLVVPPLALVLLLLLLPGSLAASGSLGAWEMVFHTPTEFLVVSASTAAFFCSASNPV
jgi:hypothetical protein